MKLLLWHDEQRCALFYDTVRAPRGWDRILLGKKKNAPKNALKKKNALIEVKHSKCNRNAPKRRTATFCRKNDRGLPWVFCGNSGTPPGIAREFRPESWLLAGVGGGRRWRASVAGVPAESQAKPHKNAGLFN